MDGDKGAAAIWTPVARFNVYQLSSTLVLIKCPQLPGLHAHGETIAEALERLPEAFQTFNAAVKDNPPMSGRPVTIIPDATEEVRFDPTLRYTLQVNEPKV